MPPSSLAFDNDGQRRRAVSWIVALTANLPPTSLRYEHQLLERHQRGELTIDQVLDLLDTSVFQVLYRSRATAVLTAHQQEELLEQARRFNADNQVTGLLLYSEDQFVQVMEGPEAVIRSLYFRIQHDPRHTQIETMSLGRVPCRRFAEWSMDFGLVENCEAERALQAIEEQQPQAGLSVTNAHLQALLQAFIG